MRHLIGTRYPVLDHGYIQLEDLMGDERAVVSAARASTDGAPRSPASDRALLRFLMRRRHTSPFEMAEIKFDIKLPIFVMRQWIRHRTADVNEFSGRYSVLPNEFYIPEISDIRQQDMYDRQSSAQPTDPTTAEAFRTRVSDISSHCRTAYDLSLGDAIARETARIILPLNIYTRMIWKIDLHNLLHFLHLRTDSHAQWEIRQYANVIGDLVKIWVPNIWEAFQDYIVQSYTFSRQELVLLRKMLQGATTYRSDFTTEREWREFKEVLRLEEWA